MQRKKMSLLRMARFAGFALLFTVLIFAMSCKALGDTGTEDEKKDYLPAAIPLESLTVEDSEGKDLMNSFQQNKLGYEIYFPSERIGEEVVVKGIAASDKAEVLVSIGETIVQNDSLTTILPEHSLKIKITVTEETGRVSTIYEVLLQLDEDAFAFGLYGSVTINGKFDQNGLTAVISSISSVLESQAIFTWYRGDVEVSSVQGTAGKTYAITEADNNAVIKVEVTVEGKDGMLTATRRAPQWESAEAIEALIAALDALLKERIGTIVVGDPAENPHSYAAILDLKDTLSTLMKGEAYEHDVINTTGGTTKERFIRYDYAQIADKTAELEKLLQTGIGYISEIIAREIVFSYTGRNEQTVKLMNQKDAVYEITLIGASGGHIYGRLINNQRGTEGGGKGARVAARYNLTKGTEYTLRVGEQGDGTAIWNEPERKFDLATDSYERSRAGGWPNGGAGGKANSSYPGGSGGGGSTDIKLKTATGVFDGSSTDPRFMVAAGGGGAAQRAFVWSAIGGADADADGIIYDKNGPISDINKIPNAGKSINEKGETGLNAVSGGLAEGPGGGGGGYKGGQAIGVRLYKGATNEVQGSGAGGASYIKQDNSYVASASIGVTTTTGNGSAHILWVGYKTN